MKIGTQVAICLSGFFGAAILSALIFGAILNNGCGASYQPDFEEGFMHPARWEEVPLHVACIGYSTSDDARCSQISNAMDDWNNRIGYDVFVPTRWDGTTIQVGVMMGIPVGSPHSNYSNRNNYEYNVVDFRGDTTIDDSSFATLRWSNGYFHDCHIAIASGIGSPELAHQVAVHELGHCLNLDHDRYESSIMFYRLGETSWEFMSWPPRISDFDRGIIRNQYFENR